MGIVFGISWDDSKKATRMVAGFVAAMLAVSLLATPGASADASRALGRLESVIVRAIPGHTVEAEQAVNSVGGHVGREIGIIDGFEAKVPAGSMAAVKASASVAHVSINGRVMLQDDPDVTSTASDMGSLFSINKVMKSRVFWGSGYTGAGVGVALIDSGVAPVKGLTGSGKVVNGADLSFDSQYDNLRYLDSYGHGTHMAGIIAGYDGNSTDMDGFTGFKGVAPDAKIINVKVAAANGATDVSQVLAAIDWVVQHRNDPSLPVPIKVLNLSFGTDSHQSYLQDPLDYAAEVAWRAGIVVVAAAGNSGFNSGHLMDPANDPYVISVGADDTAGTFDTIDDTTPDWSTRGDNVRNPDLVAPGVHIISLRDPGSYLDVNYPAGRVNRRLFRGSGTSQAAAAVSGAVALIEQAHPGITPDQVKYLLTRTADALPAADPQAQGAGEINMRKVANVLANLPTVNPIKYIQTFHYSDGTGTIEAARGSVHVQDSNGNVLTGEKDIFGNSWSGVSWSTASLAGNSWSGGMWNGVSWSGNSWSGVSWSGNSWSGVSWSGNSWSGNSWSGVSWSGNSWSGNSWSGNSWSGNSWSGVSWSGNSWSGNSWSGNSWSGNSWS